MAGVRSSESMSCHACLACFYVSSEQLGSRTEFIHVYKVGLGVGLVQTPSNTYISDIYPKYAASVMSTANLLRCLSAGFTPLVAPVLIPAIGNGWSMTILAFISAASGICVFLAQRYGSIWAKDTKWL